MSWMHQAKRSKENDPQLTEIHSVDEDVGDDGAETIASALSENCHICEIRLETNNIGPAGARGSQENKPKNQTRALYTMSWMHQVKRAKENDPQLTKIHSVDEDVGDDGAETIASALSENCHVCEIHLETNNIGPAGAAAIAQAIQNKSTLRTLNLYDNRIGNEGARSLAKAIDNSSTLVRLRLGANYIGEAALDLLAALCRNASLRELDLRWNELDDYAAAGIAALLNNGKCSVSHLDLRWNRIGNQGAQAIASALRYNSSLTSLLLYHNKADEDEAQAVSQALQENKTLQEDNVSSSVLGQIQDDRKREATQRKEQVENRINSEPRKSWAILRCVFYYMLPRFQRAFHRMEEDMTEEGSDDDSDAVSE